MNIGEDAGFWQEENERRVRMPRKDTLRDNAERLLWNLVARDETHVDLFKMSNAWAFFAELLEKEPRGEKCLLSIEPKRDKYIVIQILLDGNKKPIYKTTKACYGRTIVVDRLDRTVEKYMGNRETRIMQNPNLM